MHEPTWDRLKEVLNTATVDLTEMILLSCLYLLLNTKIFVEI